MYTGALPEITNRETWDLAFYLYDNEVGPEEYIDLSDAVITLTLRDRNDCQVLTASSDSGQIIITDDPGIFELNFADGDLARLCGTYSVGIRVHANDKTRELVRGTISILEGLDRQ